MTRLHVQPQATNDARQAARWYERQRRGLAAEFLLELDAALERVATDPGLYQVQYHQVRRILLRRFPYAAYFLLADDAIEVLAVLHQQRDPVVWRERIPSKTVPGSLPENAQSPRSSTQRDPETDRN